MKALKAFVSPFKASQRANQLISFYMRATLALNWLIIKCSSGFALQIGVASQLTR